MPLQYVKLVLRNQTLLVLKPTQSGPTYEVEVNGTTVVVEPLHPHVLQYTTNYTSQVLLYVTEHPEGTPVLHVKVRDLGLKLAYNGAKLVVNVRNPLSSR